MSVFGEQRPAAGQSLAVGLPVASFSFNSPCGRRWRQHGSAGARKCVLTDLRTGSQTRLGRTASQLCRAVSVDHPPCPASPATATPLGSKRHLSMALPIRSTLFRVRGCPSVRETSHSLDAYAKADAIARSSLAKDNFGETKRLEPQAHGHGLGTNARVWDYRGPNDSPATSSLTWHSLLRTGSKHKTGVTTSSDTFTLKLALPRFKRRSDAR
jgi:hypothetical protein